MRSLLLTFACLCVVCDGCTRVDPQHALIAAEDGPAFAAWQRKVVSEFPAALRQEFADAVQEIRFHLGAQPGVTGRDAVEAALCQRIDGHTVTEVLLLGDGFKLSRLEADRVQLQRVTNANAHLVTKPDDRAAANQLEQLRAQQQKRLDGIDADIRQAKARIAANGGAVPAASPELATSAPMERISRDEALRQIAAMLHDRRNPSILKRGGWPVKIDREGQQLDAALRTDFLARKAAAEFKGRIVIPIRIKEHWLLFEGPNQAPQLPKFVLASVTEADRRKFEEDWVNLEAEVWARDEAADFEIPKPALTPLPPLGGAAPKR